MNSVTYIDNVVQGTAEDNHNRIHVLSSYKHHHDNIYDEDIRLKLNV